MKVKKDPPKPKGIFEGLVFAMVLGPIPFKKKETLRKKITLNDGIISYLVTKKCNFVICEHDNDASNYGLKTALKLGIPIVPSSYVDTCLAEKKLVSTNIYALEQNVEQLKKLDDEFKNGKVSAKCGNELLMMSPKKSVFGTTKQLKQWSFMDNKGPDFHSHPYSVAKFTVLKGVLRRNGEISFCVIEIHASKVDEKNATEKSFDDPEKPKFCVFVDFGIFFDTNTVNRGIKSSVQTCRFTNSRNAALDCYAQLHKSYSSPPHTLSNWSRNETIPSYVGSPEFLKIRESWILTNANLDEEVQQLVSHLWMESYKYLEDILAGKISDIKLNDVNKAESILCHLLKEVNDNGVEELGQNMEKLSKNYYNLINQKTQQKLTCKTAISHQHQLLQLIRDVLTVSEGNFHEVEANSVLAIYKSLACWITHLKADSEEFLAVKEKLISSQCGNSKSILEVRNIFAVKRPAEDIGFACDMSNRQFLFHGSEAHNILGILSRGLLLNKTDYTEDGKVNSLGSGIYFSPSSSASARYSSASKTTGARFMLFAEVALGKCFITENALPELVVPPKGYQSVQGIPNENSSSSKFQDIEYAIFQECQQRLAYLIEFSLQNENLHMPQTLTSFSSVVPMEIENSAVSLKEKFSANVACDEILFAKDKKIQYGLQGIESNAIPLESVHIRASIVDLASKVVIFQEYLNTNRCSIEAKYVFPLDDLAAVCGFEAFINEKHVVGVIEEKKEAHKQYREAIAEGHGAYLMDESGQDVFTITVGNLPAFSRVVIKITYVAELKTENEHIVFDLPGCIAGDSNKDHIMLQESTTTTSSLQSSLQVGIEMPFDIRRIVAPNHSITIKKTDTMATVKLCKGQNIANGFQLWIDLAEVHVPRMWVEKSENDEEVEACMLAFYPAFFDEARETGTVIMMIDASNSMQMSAFQSAQTVALLILHHIRDNWKFNVIFFGSIYEELFPVPQLKSFESSSDATKFILEAKPNLGCTDLISALRSCFLLPPHDSEGPQNIFLVSDGNISNSTLVLQNVAKHSSETRIFTFGVGSLRLPCNQHLMKNLAKKGSGAYEYFDDHMTSKWKNKVKHQLYKSSQPALTDIQVEWQQLDDDPVPPVQAPQKVLSLFNGARQVIYGFVAHCTMATLTAKVNNTTLSTVVSTSELSKTKGRLLHSLTARAIIRDWSDGLIDEDAVKDEAAKASMNSYIISLSQKHGILSSLTSYIAIEKRNEGYTGQPCGPLVLDFVNDENVDKLSYIEYDDVKEPRANISEPELQTDHSLLKMPSQNEAQNALDNLWKRKLKKKKVDFDDDRMFVGAQRSEPVVRQYFGVPKKPSMTKEKIDSVEQANFSGFGLLPRAEVMRYNFGAIGDYSSVATDHSTKPVLETSTTLFGGQRTDSKPFANFSMDLGSAMDLSTRIKIKSISKDTGIGQRFLLSSPKRGARGDLKSGYSTSKPAPCALPIGHAFSSASLTDASSYSARESSTNMTFFSYLPAESDENEDISYERLYDDIVPFDTDTSYEFMIPDTYGGHSKERARKRHNMPEDLDCEDNAPAVMKHGHTIHLHKQLGLRPDPLEKFIIDGKGNLPLCFALIKTVSNCPWTSSWSNKMWILLKEGSVFKECELVILQSELDILATKDFIEKGTFLPMSDDIWRHQTAHGYFTMDCLDQWIYDGYASKITKILDDAGLLSLGGKREEILKMCATIATGLVFWKNLRMAEEISESDSKSETYLEQLFSLYFQENFNTKSVVALLKAFAYIVWAYKRNPLLFKSLELGLEEKVYTWEAFLLFYFTH